MIAVVVVESHHHAMEHIHDVLRRRRLLNSKWTMLHFDSHADLACPGSHIPAVSCFQPRKTIRCSIVGRSRSSSVMADEVEGDAADDGSSSSSDNNESKISTEKKNLYELLDSTASGIAEWILPLVLAANLRSLHWIRPPGTVRQIPTGEREYRVGAWLGGTTGTTAERLQKIESFLDLPLTAIVKVDWDCRYYLEDNSYVPPNELVLSQPLHLTVSEGPPFLSTLSSTMPLVQSDQHQNTAARKDGETMFALDICLDFFACLNPFVMDIDKKDVALAKALVAIVTESKFYSNEHQRTEAAYYQTELSRFRGIWNELLLSCTKIDGSASATTHHRTTSWTELLFPYYDTPATTARVIEALRTSLIAHDSQDELDALIQMSVEALPNLTMPHSCSYAVGGVGRGDVHDTSIQERLLHLRHEIRRSCCCGTTTTATDPFIVTISRSADDGFTPSSVVEELQVNVLQEIHARYCGCPAPNMGPSVAELEPGGHNGRSVESACRLHVIFDYGPWEGSNLFA